jgi:hypothetical protein
MVSNTLGFEYHAYRYISLVFDHKHIPPVALRADQLAVPHDAGAIGSDLAVNDRVELHRENGKFIKRIERPVIGRAHIERYLCVDVIFPGRESDHLRLVNGINLEFSRHLVPRLI